MAILSRHQCVDDVIKRPWLYFLISIQNVWDKALMIRSAGDNMAVILQAFSNVFFYENCWISIQTPLKFVSKVPIHNRPASVQIKAGRRLDDESLCEPLMALFTTHICVIRPDWVKCSLIADSLLTSLSYSGVKIGYLDTISAVHAYSKYNKSIQTQRYHENNL